MVSTSTVKSDYLSAVIDTKGERAKASRGCDRCVLAVAINESVLCAVRQAIIDLVISCDLSGFIDTQWNSAAGAGKRDRRVDPDVVKKTLRWTAIALLVMSDDLCFCVDACQIGVETPGETDGRVRIITVEKTMKAGSI